MFNGFSKLRVAAHAVAWLPFVYAVTRELNRGWRPVSDNAGIALRSWNVLSAHGPMVGQATRLASGVYDPGPLQYWLLSVPVHIDPLHGVLWGAALWCMLAASLTIEAAWSVAGRLGGLLATGAILGLIAWVPAIALLPCWNPWFAMMYFLAALAACLATMSGRRRWWPVLVIAGSIAAQAHLMFAVPSVAVILLGLIVGLVDTHRARASGWRAAVARYWWAVAGVAAGLACWTAPLIQEFTARNGNLSNLASGKGMPGTPTGLFFGLRALAAGVQPPPFWWSPINSLGSLGLIGQRSATAGVVVFGLAFAVLAVALCVLRSRRLTALAAVSLTVSVTSMLTYAYFPKAGIEAATTSVNNLRYLMVPLFAVGVLAWLSLGATGVLAVRAALRAAGRRAARETGRRRAVRLARLRAKRPAVANEAWAATGTFAPTAASRAASALGLTAVLCAGLALLAGMPAGVAQHRAMGLVGTAFSQIEHAVSCHRIALSVIADNNLYRRQVTFGLVYALNSAGYNPEIGTKWGRQLGPRYIYDGQPMAHVTVLAGSAEDSRLSVQVSPALPNEPVGHVGHPPVSAAGSGCDYQPLQRRRHGTVREAASLRQDGRARPDLSSSSFSAQRR